MTKPKPKLELVPSPEAEAEAVAAAADEPASGPASPGFAGFVQAEVIPDLPQYRAKVAIHFISRAGYPCTIRAGAVFTTDELAFDGATTERI